MLRKAHPPKTGTQRLPKTGEGELRIPLILIMGLGVGTQRELFVLRDDKEHEKNPPLWHVHAATTDS